MARTDARLPWFKFYGRAWRSNPKLRRCAPASRGIWADMLTLMDEAQPRGFLMTEEGAALTIEELARLIGTELKEVRRALSELEGKRVYSVVGQEMPDDVRDLIPGGIPEGVILSRRMVRDTAKALKDKENGRGGGNPKVMAGVNPPVNRRPNPQRSETRDQNTQDSGISTVAPRASAPGGARAGAPGREPLILTGAASIWTVRLKSHRPGGRWNPAHGAPPESTDENPNLDAQQRRDWRRYHGLDPDWRKAAA